MDRLCYAAQYLTEIVEGSCGHWPDQRTATPYLDLRDLPSRENTFWYCAPELKRSGNPQAKYFCDPVGHPERAVSWRWRRESSMCVMRYPPAYYRA